MYLWVKALHVIFMVTWFAGLFYLPRLFVYHAQAEVGSEVSETFKVMERRLVRIIMDPAIGAVWIFGILLAITPGIVPMEMFSWFTVKFLLVIAMSAIHTFLVRRQKAFYEDRNVTSARTYRILNEVPAVLLIGILIMVVVKPF